MNSCTSVEVKGQPIGVVTAILDGESQMAKEVMDYILCQIVWKDAFLGYPCCCSSDSGAVIGLFQLCDPTLLSLLSLNLVSLIDVVISLTSFTSTPTVLSLFLSFLT